MRLPWKWHPPPPSSLLQLGGGRGYFRGKTYHSLPPFLLLFSPLVVHWRVALISSQILRLDFFAPNTSQAGEEKGRGWAGRHFQPEIASVCLCVSQTCGSAARLDFMGKSVSHHCVLSGCQTLSGLVGCCARACVCLWSCVELLVSQSSTGRSRVQIVFEASKGKSGRSTNL